MNKPDEVVLEHLKNLERKLDKFRTCLWTDLLFGDIPFKVKRDQGIRVEGIIFADVYLDDVKVVRVYDLEQTPEICNVSKYQELRDKVECMRQDLIKEKSLEIDVLKEHYEV